MVIEITLKKQYPSLQDAIAELDQAEALEFKLTDVKVITGVTQ